MKFINDLYTNNLKLIGIFSALLLFVPWQWLKTFNFCVRFSLIKVIMVNIFLNYLI